ncbi:uncharacterized protein LOC143145083 [Ptiloglossa arizonensis]|uniref:uncharacterized protein LOC143145083 n=1 Tax=Ptiloglossa arizonensis TaxID=3350558 RepID=UPI003FA023D1
MSFRMTHYSFGPWRDSTVRVSLACGSIVRFERRLALSLGKTLVRNRLVSAVSTKLITFRRFKTERSYETFLPLVFLSCPCQLHVCRARANVFEKNSTPKGKHDEFDLLALRQKKRKMCEIAKAQRRTFRDQDPPRIRNGSADSLKNEFDTFSKSTPSLPTIHQRAPNFEKCPNESEFLEKDRETRKKEKGDSAIRESISSNSIRDDINGKTSDIVEQSDLRSCASTENVSKTLFDKVLSSGRHDDKVIANGSKSDADNCDDLTNGRDMAPVLGVPPPPPPAPHMGPDGLIVPRKPYNPYLSSSNHKDLRRELLFNQKVGRNVLNQKTELQRALEKQREAASRREAEKIREEHCKDDPRTALQRAIEQRAKHIETALEQSQTTTEPSSNLLVTARAKLRPRTDSQ